MVVAQQAPMRLDLVRHPLLKVGRHPRHERHAIELDLWAGQCVDRDTVETSVQVVRSQPGIGKLCLVDGRWTTDHDGCHSVVECCDYVCMGCSEGQRANLDEANEKPMFALAVGLDLPSAHG